MCLEIVVNHPYNLPLHLWACMGTFTQNSHSMAQKCSRKDNLSLTLIHCFSQSCVIWILVSNSWLYQYLDTNVEKLNWTQKRSMHTKLLYYTLIVWLNSCIKRAEKCVSDCMKHLIKQCYPLHHILRNLLLYCSQ